MSLQRADNNVLYAEGARIVGGRHASHPLLPSSNELEPPLLNRLQMSPARHDGHFMSGGRQRNGQITPDRPGTEHANPHRESPSRYIPIDRLPSRQPWAH